MSKPVYHPLLAGVIEQALRCPSGPIRVPELAEQAGLSRFHLTRLFREATEETLEAFLRRLRLERAAFTLQTSKDSILEIAFDCGYVSPEAFGRAFRRAFGMNPSEFRRTSGMPWSLPSPVNLHWNGDFAGAIARVPVQIRAMPVRSAAVWRVVGNYAQLAEGWERLEVRFGDQIPRPATFVTVYLDNMWTHPVTNTMRAEIGWLIRSDADLLDGMHRTTIPAGQYAVSRDFLPRNQRNRGWSSMSGAWSGSGGVAYDEYRAWPLPFESVQTRIFVGIGSRREAAR